MATSPVQVKVTVEVTVDGVTTTVPGNGNGGGGGGGGGGASATPSGYSEWDPTTAGGIRKFKVFGGVGSEVLGYVVVVNNNQNPPTTYTAGRDHWVWTGSAWIDCFRMEATGDTPPDTTNLEADMFPVNTFSQTRLDVPAGTIPTEKRLWQAARKEAAGTVTDLDSYLYKYTGADNKLHLDFFADDAEINSNNFLIWGGGAYFWNRRFTGPPNATGYRTVLGVKSN